jgi:hypothetical protein
MALKHPFQTVVSINCIRKPVGVKGVLASFPKFVTATGIMTRA